MDEAMCFLMLFCLLKNPNEDSGHRKENNLRDQGASICRHNLWFQRREGIRFYTGKLILDESDMVEWYAFGSSN